MQQEGVRAKSRAISILTQVVFVSKHYKSPSLQVNLVEGRYHNDPIKQLLTWFYTGTTPPPSPQRSFNKDIADVAILVTIQHILPS